MKGRRVPIEYEGGEARYPAIAHAGDYAGPVKGWTHDRLAVFFLKPNADHPNASRRAASIQHVCSPPHTFTEEDDGSLTIRGSIGDRAGESESDGWHGYLTKGEWHQ